MLKGINKRNLDPGANLKDDFYGYACGGWIAAHPMKGEHSRYGMFDFIYEKSRKQLNKLIKNLSANPDAAVKDTLAQKVNDIFSMVMDVETVTKNGISPLSSILKRIENLKEEEDFSETVAWLHHGLSDVFFGAGVTVDPKNSDAHIFGLTEVCLTLGDRDYYIEKSERNDFILDEYRKYVTRIMVLSGYSRKDAARVMKTVERLERLFAENKHSREQRRNPELRYNLFTTDDLKEKYKFLDWDKYFSYLKVKPEKVNITNPAFFEFLDRFIPTLTLQEIKDYYLYDVISSASSLLGEKFEILNFHLFERVMSGTRRKRPRWKRAMGMANSMFGEGIGKLYVEKYFPEENKKYMEALVENLREGLRTHITEASWMTPETKNKAIEKLETLRVKIGYPNKWKDYSGIHIDKDKSLWENVFKASLWFIDDNLGKLHKPVDKEEWHMFPQTVNAYYSPLNNEICFPAGILQPPYFDIKADDAVNYGAIGVVIGHEMTHGFDDQGHKFDKNGNLDNWWSEEDEKKFKDLSEKLVDQFDKILVAPGVHANGRFTLGENIADQGGLRVALTAYRHSQQGKKEEIIGGFTPLQRFYLSYAGLWASSEREEEKLQRVKTDPHSLEYLRVNQTLRNIDEFFKAFDIKRGDGMYLAPSKRVVIW